jgi:predicted secreted protein
VQWTSILAIYFLVWIATAFVMLPFGVRTADEEGVAKVPGQAESAPVNFRPGRLALRATVLAAVLTGIYVLNYEQGWITASDLDLMPEPPAELQR